MDILGYISKYTYYVNRYNEITETLEALTYRTTTTYGNLAPAMSNSYNSKVENMALRETELKSEQMYYKQRIDTITKIIERSGLNEHEKGALWCVAKCERLQSYARAHNIQQSNIYKIRDRAAKKAINYVMQHKKGKMLTKNTN